MKKTKKQRQIMFLLILIVGITIGFALLSTTLYINGIAGIKKNTWNVHWDDTSIVETQGSVTATTPAAVTDTNKTNISFEVEFELPGDYYEFTADAINEGSIDGIISNVEVVFYQADGVTPYDTNNPLPSEIVYSLTHADGTAIAEDEVITHGGGTIGYKFRIGYNSQTTTLPAAPIVVKPKIEITPVQHKEEVTPAPVDEFGYNVDSGDSVTYYAPGITANGVSTLDPTWTVFGYDNATKDEQKVCIVYNNEKVCSKAYDTWDCQPNSNYTHCTNEDSPIYKMEGKLTPILGQGMEIYITPPTGIQYYKVIGNYSVGFTMDAYETDAYTQDGLCKYITTGTSQGFGCFLP